MLIRFDIVPAQQGLDYKVTVYMYDSCMLPPQCKVENKTKQTKLKLLETALMWMELMSYGDAKRDYQKIWLLGSTQINIVKNRKCCSNIYSLESRLISGVHMIFFTISISKVGSSDGIASKISRGN